MSRRAVVAAAVLVVLGLVLVPAGAFSGGFASETTGSGLAIEAADSPNGEYADFSDGRLALDFSAGGGLSDNAINRFDAVFTVTNDRNYEAPVWINDSSEAITFYNTSSGASVEGEENGPTLAPGETLVVGVSVDTREVDVESVESTDDFAVETLVEESSETETSGTDSSGTETTDTTGSESTATATATSGGGSGSGGSGGGGGGGGGGGSGTTESSYEVYNTSTGATVDVREGVPGDPIEADLSGSGSAYVSGSGTTVDVAALALTFERNGWRVELTTPTDSPQDAPAVSSGEAVSYVRYDAYNVEPSAFDSIAVNLTVSDLPSGTDPSQVTVYRHTADGWQPVETTHLGGDRYHAATGGFGELAVVVEDGSGSDGGSDGTETDGGTGSASGTAGDSDGSVGGSDENGTATDATDSGDTQTATAAERLEGSLPVQSGMGPATVLVFGVFTAWLGVRARVGGKGPGGL